MSNVDNTFLETVADWIDDHDGMSYIPKRAEELLDAQDYEELARFMAQIDADLSREHFHNTNQIEATDVY